MAGKNLHTTYNKSAGNWRNVREGSNKPIKTYETKREAQNDGQRIAKNQKVEHLIHNQDGKIGQRNSYGKDDFPPKG